MNRKWSLLFICLPLMGYAQTALDTYILDQMDTKHIPGVSSVIIQDGRLVWSGNYGTANLTTGMAVDTNTVFMLASISKTIAVTAAMQLYEDGYFELDDDINMHLPFTIYHPDYPDSVITMRMIMTHSSALRDNWDILDTVYVAGDSPLPLSAFVQGYFEVGGPYYYADDNFYGYAPGVNYNYCNMGISLLGYLVELFSGQPFNTYCNEHIFEPMCMTNTGWFLSELDTNLIAHPYDYVAGEYVDYGLYGYPDYPDGQLRTTALSLAKFLYMYMQGGSFEGVQILEPETVDLILSSQIPMIDPTQGLVWYSYTDGGTWWGHSGGDSGVSTDMYFKESTQTGVILLTNSDNSTLNIWNEIVAYADTVNSDNSPALTCEIILPVNIDESDILEVHIQPNPASDWIYLQTKETIASYSISNIHGEIEQSGVLQNASINISNLVSGLHYIELQGPSSGKRNIQAFVKL
ncbi:MAG TPA: serine hydrolase [Chitinophagales bacterium]|nr:serine hydrolase [Chitinophagales bacterium]